MTDLIYSYYVQDGNLYHNDEFSSNFVPEICNAFASPLTGEVVIEVGFKISGDTEYHKFTIPILKLDSVEFEKIDSRCICFDEKGNSTRKTVLNYIRLQWANEGSTLPVGIYLDRLGWNSDRTFTAGPQLLGVKPDGPCRFSPDIRALHPVSPLPVDPGPVVERVLLGVRENNDVYLPLLVFAVMSPLRAVFVKNGLPACAVLNLQGPYGRGKTHAAQTFFNHYNRSNGEPAFFLETNSTERAVLNVLKYASGQTVVLDDIAQGSSKTIGSKRTRLAAEVLRMAQNNAPREKMDGKDGVQEKREACVVLTGELSPDAESEVTRCIRIDIKEQLMGGPSREDVAAAIFSFIDWFGRNSEREIARLREDFAVFTEGLKENPTNEQVRVQKSLWEMSWAMSSFLRFAKSVQAVGDDAAGEIDQVMSEIIQKKFQETCLRLRKPPESTEFLARIISDGVSRNAFPCRVAQNCLCVRRDYLVEYLRRAAKLQNMPDNAIIDMLKNANLLRMDRSGKSTRKINGIRCLTIPQDALPE